MAIPVTIRIAIVVIGFALIVVAELVDNANARKPAATGAPAPGRTLRAVLEPHRPQDQRRQH